MVICLCRMATISDERSQKCWSVSMKCPEAGLQDYLLVIEQRIEQLSRRQTSNSDDEEQRGSSRAGDKERSGFNGDVLCTVGS